MVDTCPLILILRYESPDWCGSVVGVITQTKRSPVQFPVRARAWVMGSVPSWSTYNRQLFNVSLPLFLPPFPSL